MKNSRVSFLLVLVLFSAGLNPRGHAQIWEPIPDTGFVSFLTEWYPELMNGDELNIEAAATYAPELVCSERGISDLYGVQYFHSMQVVDASFNNLISIPDIQDILPLRTLNLSNNGLVSLPSLNANINLEQLLLSGNLLNSLPDLRFNTKLKTIIAPHNKIEVIQSLADHPDLEEIHLQYNQIEDFPDLHPDAQINILHLNNNGMTKIEDFSDRLRVTSTVSLQNNKLTFQYLEPFAEVAAVGAFDGQEPELPDYAPQIVLEQQPLSLNLGFDSLAKNNRYDWYKNGVYLQTTSTNSLDFQAVTSDHGGDYHCVVSNTLPGLDNMEFISDTFSIQVIGCLSIDMVGIDPIDETCDENGAVILDIVVNGDVQLTGYRLLEGEGSVINSPVQDTITGLAPGVYELVIEGLPQGASSVCEYYYPTPFTIMENTEDCNPDAVDTTEVVVDDSRELTPNGDGFNDSYPIEEAGTARIFDKNGRLVVELSVPGEWDGTDKTGAIKTTGLYLIEINGEARETIYLIR